MADLSTAVTRGDASEVLTLLQGSDMAFSLAHGDGSKLLHAAALRGDAPTAGVLLRFGALVDARSESRQATPLHDAAAQGHVAVVTLLLDHDAAVDARRGDGSTPLMLASKAAHAAVVGTLLRAGAAVNLAQSDGVTALMFAAKKGAVSVAVSLLSAGADKSLVDGNGRTAFDMAWEHMNLRLLLQLVPSPQRWSSPNADAPDAASVIDQASARLATQSRDVDEVLRHFLSCLAALERVEGSACCARLAELQELQSCRLLAVDAALKLKLVPPGTRPVDAALAACVDALQSEAAKYRRDAVALAGTIVETEGAAAPQAALDLVRLCAAHDDAQASLTAQARALVDAPDTTEWAAEFARARADADAVIATHASCCGEDGLHAAQCCLRHCDAMNFKRLLRRRDHSEASAKHAHPLRSEDSHVLEQALAAAVHALPAAEEAFAAAEAAAAEALRRFPRLTPGDPPSDPAAVFKAARAGDFTALLHLLRHNPALASAQSADGRPLLHHGAASGDADVVALIRSFPGVNPMCLAGDGSYAVELVPPSNQPMLNALTRATPTSSDESSHGRFHAPGAAAGLLHPNGGQPGADGSVGPTTYTSVDQGAPSTAAREPTWVPPSPAECATALGSLPSTTTDAQADVDSVRGGDGRPGAVPVPVAAAGAETPVADAANSWHDTYLVGVCSRTDAVGSNAVLTRALEGSSTSASAVDGVVPPEHDALTDSEDANMLVVTAPLASSADGLRARRP